MNVSFCLLITLLAVVILPVVYSYSEPCCQRGHVRLRGEGSDNSAGLVEVCGSRGNALIWKTVCTTGWDEKEVQVVCRQLGLEDDRASLLPKIIRFNATIPGERINKNWQCNGKEANLLECADAGNSPSCIVNNTRTRAGVNCSGLRYGCEDFDVRLVNGYNNESGRVEVCLNQTWRTVRDDAWNSNDANTVCKQLGYAIGIPTRKAYFGEVNAPVHLSRVQCGTSDRHLSDCSIELEVNRGGDNDDVVGVICKDETEIINCQDWDVRLVGGENQGEGRIEVCYNRIWGTVCDYGWDVRDATVVCQQLGYALLETYGVPMSGSQFGVCDSSVLLNNVTCTEDHSQLSQCVHPLSIGFQNCSSGHVVGIKCTEAIDSSSNLNHSKSKDSSTPAIIGGTVGVLIILGLTLIVIVVGVVVILVIKKKRLRRKDMTSNTCTESDNNVATAAGLDNPTYGESTISVPLATVTKFNSMATVERDFHNPLYSAVSSPNGTDKHIYDGIYSESTSGNLDCTDDDGREGAGVFEAIGDQTEPSSDGEINCYSTLDYSEYSKLQHSNVDTGPTRQPVLPNVHDYSCLQHK